MADPVRFRLSNSSDDSPYQEDHSDSEHETEPVDDREDAIEPIQTLDPRNSQLSLVSGAGHSLTDRRHRRASISHRDFYKYLVAEGYEAKKLNKLLRGVLDELSTETRRAQEAERRALELAHRFKLVNEARIAAQQEVDRVQSELRLYKVQLENAQREINRGSDLLRDIEAQRDNAEAAAARARSTARRLKEEQLMMKAREEGRREGYKEGLRQGYQQARLPTSLDDLEVPPAGVPPLSSLVGGTSTAAGADELGRTDPLDGFSMMNLRTPPPMADMLPASSDPYGAGAEGSRFREIMATPSTFRSAPLASGSQSGGGWPTQDEEVRYIRPSVIRNAPPSPQHGDYPIPADGYIPSMGADNFISLPPPHELHRPPSMSSIVPSTTDEVPHSTAAPGVASRSYAYTPRHQPSPHSFADSLPSTTISQFEILNNPTTATRGLRERSSGLSAIPEVSSLMEYSPGTDGRLRTSIHPDTLSRNHSRDRISRDDGEARYSDPDTMDRWRQSSASQSHPSSPRERLNTPQRPSRVTSPSPLGGPSFPPSSAPSPSPSHRRSRSVQSPPTESYLGAGSSSTRHRRTSSSTPISIEIEPPSGPGSNLSPSSAHDGMLSPDVSHRPLSSSQRRTSTTPTPDRPGSRGYAPENHPYGYAPPRSQSPYYAAPPSQPFVVPSSPRHTPDPMRGYPVYPSAGSSTSVGQGRPQSRAASGEYGRAGYDFAGRPTTPDRPRSTRPVSPSQSRPGYADPPGRVPSVLRSPSRASSRQSVQPELARPSSRTSADPRLSFNAGATPAMVPRPLSGGAQQLHRVPSASSINSETSRKSGAFVHYDPSSYVDPAFLASAEDLTSMQSPNTMANTRANSAWTGPGPSRLRPTSPSMSYSSFRS